MLKTTYLNTRQTVRVYVELNVHIVDEQDFNHILDAFRKLLGVESVQVEQLSQTELLVDIPEDFDVLQLKKLKYVERIGSVIAQFPEEETAKLVDFLKSRNFTIIPKVRDFRLKLLLLQRVPKANNLSQNVVLVRDYIVNDRREILVVQPLCLEMFADLVNMFYDSHTGDVVYIVCDVESEHEAVSCVRICCALKVRVFLVNPQVQFTDRRLHEDFKKFYGMCKVRTFKTLGECLDYVKERFRNVLVFGLSMHASSGERTLERILRDNPDKIPVFVLGSERWGLKPSQIELCDYVVRLGPSTGFPMSISECIAYTTLLVRKVRSSTCEGIEER